MNMRDKMDLIDELGEGLRLDHGIFREERVFMGELVLNSDLVSI